MASSKGMHDAIRAQVAGLTEGQRIFMANHMFKHYGVYPTKLKGLVENQLEETMPLQFDVGDVVTVTSSFGDYTRLAEGQKVIVTDVDSSDEMYPYRVFAVGSAGEEIREWARAEQVEAAQESLDKGVDKSS